MRNTTKIWLIIAASLVLIGCIVFGSVIFVLQWDFAELSTVKNETNHYEIDAVYRNISIVTDTADIVFALSETPKTSVVCLEQENRKHSVTVKDDTLVIEVADEREWYEYIGIGLGESEITVCLPQKEFGILSVKSNTGDVEIPKDLSFENMDISGSTGDVTSYASAVSAAKIETSTGNIHVENISTGTLELSVSTGRITASGVVCKGDLSIEVSTGKTNLTDIVCKNFISNGDTGDITLNHVIATEKLSIKNGTGDVKFDSCDAAEISVETDTGKVAGSLLTEKVFIIETSTGKIDVPETTTGGRCEITTDTGNIRITVN